MQIREVADGIHMPEQLIDANSAVFVVVVFGGVSSSVHYIIHSWDEKKTRFYCYVNRNFSVTRNWDRTHAFGTLGRLFFKKKRLSDKADACTTSAVCIYRRRMYNKQMIRFIHIYTHSYNY